MAGAPTTLVGLLLPLNLLNDVPVEPCVFVVVGSHHEACEVVQVIQLAIPTLPLAHNLEEAPEGEVRFLLEILLSKAEHGVAEILVPVAQQLL